MFWRRRKASDFAAEIEAHIQLEEDRLRSEGVAAEEARAAALRAFGNRTARQEEFYENSGTVWLEAVGRDVRLALRALGRERSFAAFAVLLIGLGAGLTTAMFALYNGVALRKLPVPDPDRLIHVYAINGEHPMPVRYAIFERLAEVLDAEAAAGWSGSLAPVTYGGETRVASVEYIAGDLAGTLGVRPILGRGLAANEDGPAAVISDVFWQRIGGDPGIVGQVLRVGPAALTVVGVAPANSIELTRFYKADVIVPLEVGLAIENIPAERARRYGLDTMVRLKPGVTIEQARNRLEELWPRLVEEAAPASMEREQWRRMAGVEVRVEPGAYGGLTAETTLPRVTLTLLALAGLVSLAMCANLAGLLFSRGIGKQREYGMRLALGAKRRHLVRYALVEVLILSCAGGAAAIVIAHWLVRISLRALASPGVVAADYGVRMDGRVIAFGLLVAVTAAVAAQLVPALRISGVRVLDSIRRGMQTFAARLGGRKAVLVAQVAASLVLVSGSLLFVRTLQTLTRVETGFEAKRVVAVRIAPRVPWPEAGPEYFYELLRRVRAIPGVAAAGLSDRVPMQWDAEVTEPIAVDFGGAGAETTAERGCIWPGVFEALRIPVLAGRDVSAGDREVALLTRSLAEALFPDGSAVGQAVRLGRPDQERTLRVLGVVGDARFRSLRQSHTRMAFVPCRDIWKPPETGYWMALLIRTEGASVDVVGEVRRELAALGKQVVLGATPVERVVSNSVRNEQTLSTIATGFGAFTLLLTCAGVYALIDLTVRSRWRELGIRMAVGASEARIVGLMLGGLGRLLVAGTVAGIGATYVVVRVWRAYLYGADFEPWVMAGAFGVVATLAFLAALVPAWRAARTAPASVLRLGV